MLDNDYNQVDPTWLAQFSGEGIPRNILVNHEMEIIYLQSGTVAPGSFYLLIEDALDECGGDCIQDADEDGILNNYDNCPGIFNPDQMDYDEDGIGDYCDDCNGVTNIIGNVDGNISTDDEIIINVMDLLKLCDAIEDEIEIDDCLIQTGDVTGDGVVNLIDIYAFATMLINDDFDN